MVAGGRRLHRILGIPDPPRRDADPHGGGGPRPGLALCPDRHPGLGSGRLARLCHRRAAVDQFGHSIIAFYHLDAQFEAFRSAFDRYGGWIVLIKGATPIPYKLVTIASGVAHLDPLTFTLASIGSRALRFFIVAALLWRFGEPVRNFVEKRLVLVTSAFAALLVGGYLVLRLA